MIWSNSVGLGEMCFSFHASWVGFCRMFVRIMRLRRDVRRVLLFRLISTNVEDDRNITILAFQRRYSKTLPTFDMYQELPHFDFNFGRPFESCLMVSVDFLVLDEGEANEVKNHHLFSASFDHECCTHFIWWMLHIILMNPYDILSVLKQSVVVGRSLVVNYHRWTNRLNTAFCEMWQNVAGPRIRYL